MAKKNTVAKNKPGENVKGKGTKRHLGKSNPNYSRDYLIDQVVNKVAEDGITGINAAKELRSMLSEEAPDKDLVIDAYFVPILFDDEHFVACMSKATKL